MPSRTATQCCSRTAPAGSTGTTQRALRRELEAEIGGVSVHGICRQFNHKKRRFAVPRMIKFVVFSASISSRKSGPHLPPKTRAE
jgi:hypothetical protein